MPDISMCNGVNGARSCSQLSTCHRFTALPDENRQSYFTTAPFETDGACRYYWANTGLRRADRSVAP